MASFKREEKREKYEYIPGFGSTVSTEAKKGALPIGQNSPQVCPYGLYAEQLSGSAFTAPRSKNFRSWCYRMRPSVTHRPYLSAGDDSIYDDFESLQIDPNQFRWSPAPLLASEDAPVDFASGLKVKIGAGDPSSKNGLCIYDYLINASMVNKAMQNSDGDFLIIPQVGTLDIATEFGRLTVEPQEIVVIPRGIKFSVAISESSRGYVLEIFKGHFELPNLGPIGANGLANPRDFLTPVAWFEEDEAKLEASHTIINKYMQKMFTKEMDHSPFDVVAWHGNYYPYKYDLRYFNCMNTVSFDHPDPSIYTVLTCPSDEPGTAIADFVIFPPRWMVAENTFRPPWYHRNCMSEYMGMIYGTYDAKVGGFVPGGSSLHSCMSAHGPDFNTFTKASNAELAPHKFDGGLAFMFESCLMMKVATSALSSPLLQKDYFECWQQLPRIYNGDIDAKPSK